MAEIDTTKEQQRSALHRAIWGIADDVRGAVDGWDFKMYILGFLFYRFISEDLAAYIDEGEHEAGDAAFSYAAMSDVNAEAAREGIIEEKGYFMLPSELFVNVAARCDKDSDLNETVKAVFDHIEGSSIGRLPREASEVFSTISTSTPTSLAVGLPSATAALSRLSRA